MGSLAAWLAVAVTIGALLRAIHLAPQVLIGDELHALGAALSRPLPEILRSWTFAGADTSVPLTAFYRALLDAGVRLTEWHLRAPVLASGLLTIVVLPLLVRRRVGETASAVFALLLAISPLLVVYSRLVRSYMPMVLLALAAVLIFHDWWRKGRRTAAAAYVGLGAAAIWVHLGAGPLVAAPLLWAGVMRLRRPALGRSSGHLALVAIALAVATGLLLLPAAASLRDLLGLHGGGRLPTPAVWLEIGRLQLGHGSALVAGGLALVAARGAAALWRREPEWLGYLATLAAVQLVGLALLRPHLFEALQVATRYTLPLLPLLLLLLAVGLTDPLPARAAGRFQALLVGSLLVLLVLGGPLLKPGFRASPFAHAPVAITFSAPQDRMPAEALPQLYHELGEACAASACEQAVIEFPWLNSAHHAFLVYQRAHGRDVLLGSLDRQMADPRLALRNTLPRDPSAFLDSDAGWLVVHLDLELEEAAVTSSLFQFQQRLAGGDALWLALRRAGGSLARELESLWGAPDRRERSIAAWDLDRVRAMRDPAPDAR